MAKRPFLSKGIDELELMFKSSGSDPVTLTALEEELIHLVNATGSPPTQDRTKSSGAAAVHQQRGEAYSF